MSLTVRASVGIQGAGIHQHPLEVGREVGGVALQVADLGAGDELDQEDDQGGHYDPLTQEHHSA